MDTIGRRLTAHIYRGDSVSSSFAVAYPIHKIMWYQFGTKVPYELRFPEGSTVELPETKVTFAANMVIIDPPLSDNLYMAIAYEMEE